MLKADDFKVENIPFSSPIVMAFSSIALIILFVRIAYSKCIFS